MKSKKAEHETVKIEHFSDSATLDISFDTMKKGKQAIIFANTKNSAEKTAEEIAKKIKDNDPYLTELGDKILRAVSKPTKQCERLAFCVRKGTAFHHSGLVAKQRELIESNFKQGKIKIIAATPTLAAGVDLPAYRVILKDLKRFSQRGMQYIPVLEYLQMAGRAGRPKYDSVGEAITIATTEGEAEELENRYIHGKPEAIFSKLAVEPVLRTYLLSLIASKFLRTEEQLYEFFSETFWAHQFEDVEKLRGIIDKMLYQLIEWGFIEKIGKSSEFVDADEFGSKYNATLIGKRVAELYLDPYTAFHLITCCKRASSVHLSPLSFTQMISHTLEMRPLLSVRTKDVENIESCIVENDSSWMDLEPSMYDFEYPEYLSSVKTAMFMQAWIDETDEEKLLEDFNIRPGEIRAKLEIAEWLLYSTEELCRINKEHKLIAEIRKLRVRLKYGVKEELLSLLRLKGIGRVRARALFRNGMKDLGDVRKADLTTLSQILGKAVAEDVKKQLGEKQEAVKENKRKGQINLNDYEE